MPKNVLTLNEPRIGWLVDGDAQTPDLAVMLRKTDVAIELLLPLRGAFGHDMPYGRWIGQGIEWGDDPDRTKYSYRPPAVLLFHDSDGSVVLVGCRAAGSTTNFYVGHGQIIANYAVLGGDSLQYEAINGLRTESPGLAAWTRLSSQKLDVKLNAERRIESIHLSLSEAPAVPLSHRLNLTLRSTWRTDRELGTFTVFEAVQVETLVGKTKSWPEHLSAHRAVLDLASISAWEPFGFSAVQVSRADDPARNAGGGDMGPRWSSVETHRLPKHSPWKRTPNFLFPWSEVGPAGVKRWLGIRHTHAQAVSPLLTILRSDDRWTYSNVVQSGIALEALGYQIEVDNGGSKLNSRGQLNYRNALEIILHDMPTHQFPETESWMDNSRDVYMGSKHPDRISPDSLIVANTLRENLLILRFWLGQKLGVSGKSLTAALATDPLNHEWVVSA